MCRHDRTHVHTLNEMWDCIIAANSHFWKLPISIQGSNLLCFKNVIQLIYYYNRMCLICGCSIMQNWILQVYFWGRHIGLLYLSGLIRVLFVKLQQMSRLHWSIKRARAVIFQQFQSRYLHPINHVNGKPMLWRRYHYIIFKITQNGCQKSI